MHAPKHKWHEFDAELELQVCQATCRFRRNKWKVRNRAGRVVELNDEEFNRLRIDPEWVLSHHRGFLDG